MNLRDLASEEFTGKAGPVPASAALQALPPRMTIPRAAKPVGRDPQPDVERCLFPEDGNQPFTERVSPWAVAKVDAIRDQALALGWSRRRLYQNRGQFRFPCGDEYGLVCFIGETQHIGEVTRQYIEIIGPPLRENRLRFYNPDVPQPWRAARLSPSAGGRGLSRVTD
jgi:hypothetical protein